MTETTVFLDDAHRIVPEVQATRMVVHTSDDQGQFVSEQWFELAPPRSADIGARRPRGPGRGLLVSVALAAAAAGFALGWFLAR